MKEKLENKQTEANEEIKNFDSEVAEMQGIILKRLKKYFNEKLTENKIPYRELTKLSGVSTSVIADFLKGGSSVPRIDTLIRLSLVIAPDDIDNMFRLMFKNPDSNEPVRPEEALRRALMDLGLEHNDIVDVRQYIRYINFRAEERKERQRQREERQLLDNQRLKRSTPDKLNKS